VIGKGERVNSATLTGVRSSVAAIPTRTMAPGVSPASRSIGEWLSLVEHLVRDQGVGGSNPLSPTNPYNHLEKLLSQGTPMGIPVQGENCCDGPRDRLDRFPPTNCAHKRSVSRRCWRVPCCRAWPPAALRSAASGLNASCESSESRYLGGGPSLNSARVSRSTSETSGTKEISQYQAQLSSRETSPTPFFLAIAS
jgi:hypothetical protein